MGFAFEVDKPLPLELLLEAVVLASRFDVGAPPPAGTFWLFIACLLYSSEQVPRALVVVVAVRLFRLLFL